MTQCAADTGQRKALKTPGDQMSDACREPHWLLNLDEWNVKNPQRFCHSKLYHEVREAQKLNYKLAVQVVFILLDHLDKFVLAR